MEEKMKDLINQMLEAVKDVKAIPGMREDEVEKELQKRIITILDEACK